MRPIGSGPPKRSLDPIVDQLRQERLKQNLSQEAIGLRAKRCSQLIHEWERGRNDPCLRNLHNWCHALGFRLVLEPVVPRVLDQPGHAESSG